MADARSRRGALALRVLVSAALIAIVLAYADVGQLAATIRGGQWEWFLVALVVMSAAIAVGAVRWWLLLVAADVDVRFSAALRAFATSLLLNHTLPTAVAGDIVRTWVVGRSRGRLIAATAATIVDKLTALTCLFAVGWIAMALDRDAVPEIVIVVFAWVTLGLVLALSVLGLAVAGVRPVLHRLPEKVASTARESWQTVRVWFRSTRVAGSLLGLGLAYQVVAVAALLSVAATVDVDLSFALAAVTAAIVLVATLVPISVGGLGIREGGFIILLGKAGIDAAEATLVSLLSAAVVVLSSAAVVAGTYLAGGLSVSNVRVLRGGARSR